MAVSKSSLTKAERRKFYARKKARDNHRDTDRSTPGQRRPVSAVGVGGYRFLRGIHDARHLVSVRSNLTDGIERQSHAPTKSAVASIQRFCLRTLEH